ncbi:hypothetical protein IMCC14465_13680 [alpha proteobacterium IMCC14465]|uniref:Uncharacterized protein n=1 Tax=alpha proteobacterium IMCC14465 TaxID=1220535 RepID=J9DX49_9PROT|nr:hypothetical protein IMCC14465_13680 [alpha proteobacterium IMCC14465]
MSLNIDTSATVLVTGATGFFGLIGILFLHLGRKHYALSMKNAESRDEA